MADVDQLFQDFIEQDLAGSEPDVGSFLARVSGKERGELGQLIDAYLLEAPSRPWDPERFRDSATERMVERLDQSLRGHSGLWPSLLPRLRDRARLTRRQLTERLAAALGQAGREEKVASYYHQMEHGLLPAHGVSARVLEALSEIVGAPVDVLRRAGEAMLGEREELGPETAMARLAMPEEAYAEDRLPAGGPGPAPREAEWDEVDELFRGG
jgi:hypothetical protein